MPMLVSTVAFVSRAEKQVGSQVFRRHLFFFIAASQQDVCCSDYQVTIDRSMAPPALPSDMADDAHINDKNHGRAI